MSGSIRLFRRLFGNVRGLCRICVTRTLLFVGFSFIAIRARLRAKLPVTAFGCAIGTAIGTTVGIASGIGALAGIGSLGNLIFRVGGQTVAGRIEFVVCTEVVVCIEAELVAGYTAAGTVGRVAGQPEEIGLGLGPEVGLWSGLGVSVGVGISVGISVGTSVGILVEIFVVGWGLSVGISVAGLVEVLAVGQLVFIIFVGSSGLSYWCLAG